MNGLWIWTVIPTPAAWSHQASIPYSRARGNQPSGKEEFSFSPKHRLPVLLGPAALRPRCCKNTGRQGNVFTGWLEILKAAINSLLSTRNQNPLLAFGLSHPPLDRVLFQNWGRLILLMAFSMNPSQPASIFFEDYDLTSTLRNL